MGKVKLNNRRKVRIVDNLKIKRTEKNNARKKVDFETYKKLRNECNKLVLKSKKDDLGKELSENPNRLWKKFDQIVKGVDERKMRLIEEGVVIEDGKEIAKIIGNHYDEKIKKIKNEIEATECNEDPLKHIKNWGKDINAEFTLPEFTNKDVIKAIENMKITQATGRTGLSKKLLHLARNVIAQHLANIFNKSIADKKYPEEFKRLKALSGIKRELKQLKRITD